MSKDNTISARVNKDIYDVLNMVIQTTPFSKTDIIELGILEFIAKLEKDFDLKTNKASLTYNGIELTELAKIKRADKLRQLQSIKRRHLKSRDLFIDRVKQDLILYTLKGKKKDQMVRLLEEYRKEALQYTDNEKVLKEIDFLISQANNTEYLNHVEKDVKGQLEYMREVNNGRT